MPPNGSRDLPAEAGSPPPKRKAWVQIGKLIFSVGIGVLLVHMLHRGGLPLVPPAQAFADVRWWAVGGYVALVLASWFFRGVRWRLLLRPVAPVSAWAALNAVLIGSAAVLILPLRLGETARPILIARDKRVSMFAALGTVVAERIIDGLILSLILGAALLTVPTLDPLPAHVVGMPIPVNAVRGYAWTFLVVFAGAFVVILGFHAARDLGVKLTQAVFGRISPRLGELIATTLERFADGLSFFRHRSISLQFLLETGIYWLLAVLGHWLLGWGTGVVHADSTSITFGESAAILGMLVIAAALPGPPGLIGLFQAGVYAGMTMYFPKHVITGPGSAFVFLLYAVHIGLTLLTSGVCLIINFMDGRPALSGRA